MKQKYTHLLAMVMVLVILLAGISGCSPKKTEESSTSTTAAETATEATEATTEATEEPVEIDYLAYSSFGEPSQDSEIVKMVEEKFNVKFNFWYVDPANFDAALNIRLASGEMPDVFVPIGTNLSNYVDQGIVAPLDKSLIEQYAPTYYAYLNEEHPKAWAYSMRNGELAGLPTVGLDGSWPTVTLWNKTWLDNVGITKVPETIEEVEVALYKFRNEDPDGNGVKDTYGMSDFAIPYILGAYGYPGIYGLQGAIKGQPGVGMPTYVTDENKIIIGTIEPEMKDALALLQKWYKDGLIDPEFITSEHTDGHWAQSQAFINNRIGLTGSGMFYHWRNELDANNPEDKGGALYAEFKQLNPDSEIAIGTSPIGPNGKSGAPQWGIYSGNISFTTKGVEDPRKVAAILSMIEANFTDEEFAKLTYFGIEGVDYDVVDGKVVSKHTDWTPADLNKAGIWVFSQGLPQQFFRDLDPVKYAFADKHMTTGYVNINLPTGEAFQQYSTALTQMVVEAYISIITGEKSIDYFDEFVTEFKANGGQEVLDELNAYYSNMIGTN